LYRQVLDLDPESSPAHARLAQALLYQGNDLGDAEKHARRAVQLDPNLSEAHTILGLVLATQFAAARVRNMRAQSS
jgi:Flp pilus assembly protein TadD